MTDLCPHASLVAQACFTRHVLRTTPVFAFSWLARMDEADLARSHSALSLRWRVWPTMCALRPFRLSSCALCGELRGHKVAAGVLRAASHVVPFGGEFSDRGAVFVYDETNSSKNMDGTRTSTECCDFTILESLELVCASPKTLSMSCSRD